MTHAHHRQINKINKTKPRKHTTSTSNCIKQQRLVQSADCYRHLFMFRFISTAKFEQFGDESRTQRKKIDNKNNTWQHVLRERESSSEIRVQTINAPSKAYLSPSKTNFDDELYLLTIFHFGRVDLPNFYSNRFRCHRIEYFFLVRIRVFAMHFD